MIDCFMVGCLMSENFNNLLSCQRIKYKLNSTARALVKSV